VAAGAAGGVCCASHHSLLGVVPWVWFGDDGASQNSKQRKSAPVHDKMMSKNKVSPSFEIGLVQKPG